MHWRTFSFKEVQLYLIFSTITTWGREGERDAFSNMLNNFPKGAVSIVSDSYDIWNACEKVWGEELKGLVEGRDGTLVVRPDSGEPTEVVVKVTVTLCVDYPGIEFPFFFGK
jgi:nicotinamide phosphoribosyltransferase